MLLSVATVSTWPSRADSKASSCCLVAWLMARSAMGGVLAGGSLEAGVLWVDNQERLSDKWLSGV